MKIIGVDPGVTGAFAILTDDGAFDAVEDLPITQWGKAKWVDAPRLCSRLFELLEGKPARGAVEHTHAMPRMGSIASNSKGMTLGSTLAALQMARVSVELVSPAAWKSALDLTGKATDAQRKKKALARARLLFPSAPLDREQDHNRAEALLIAWWRQRVGENTRGKK